MTYVSWNTRDIVKFDHMYKLTLSDALLCLTDEYLSQFKSIALYTTWPKTKPKNSLKNLYRAIKPSWQLTMFVLTWYTARGKVRAARIRMVERMMELHQGRWEWSWIACSPSMRLATNCDSPKVLNQPAWLRAKLSTHARDKCRWEIITCNRCLVGVRSSLEQPPCLGFLLLTAKL